MNDPNDPFIELGLLVKAIGLEKTIKAALAVEEAIEATNNWLEHVNGANDYHRVRDFLRDHPTHVVRLYVESWKLLDIPGVVVDLLAAGYDGAIHGGIAATRGEPEYRVFSPTQVVFALDRAHIDPFLAHRNKEAA